MKKGKVLRINSFALIDFLKKNLFFIIVFIFFIIGTIIGTFISHSNKILFEYSAKYVSDYIAVRSNSSFGGILVDSFFGRMASLFFCFFLGTSLFGVITLPAFVFLKGTFYAGVVSYLYSTYGIKGVAFNTVVLIPSAIIFIIVLLIAAKEAFRLSLKISGLTLSGTMPFDLSSDFKNFSTYNLFLAVFMLISSLVDACVSSAFIKHFIF